MIEFHSLKQRRVKRNWARPSGTLNVRYALACRCLNYSNAEYWTRCFTRVFETQRQAKAYRDIQPKERALTN
jgi:hypothetical protein